MRRTSSTTLLAAALLGSATQPANAAPMTTNTAVTRDFNSCGYFPKTTVMLRTGPSTQRSAIG